MSTSSSSSSSRRSSSSSSASSSASLHNHKRDQRSNSSTSIKSRFEKRLGRIKKIGGENKIAESVELEEGREATSSMHSSNLSRTAGEPITFSSIFGDASLFESEVNIFFTIQINFEIFVGKKN